MGKIFVTSDYHFNHNKSFLYGARGYHKIGDMNQDLMLIHNAVVSPDDDVYILGDVCMGGADTLESSKMFIEKMNGRLHIIRGNHDTNAKVQMYLSCKNVVEAEKWAEMIKYRGQSFYLSHFPAVVRNTDDNEPHKKPIINLFGHTHQTTLFYEDNTNMFHVGVDGNGGCPWLLDEILDIINRAKLRQNRGEEVATLKCYSEI